MQAPGTDFGTVLSFDEIKEKSDKFILNTYKRAPVAFHFGQGAYLFDSENKQYLDFLSGVAVTGLGHGDADLVEALRDQADKVWHTSNLVYSEEQAKLAEVLISYTFNGKVFFCNSGTEAIEAAYKLARRHGLKKGGAFKMLSLENSFHGRTSAAMNLTGQEKIYGGFGPRPEEFFTHLPANDLQALETELEQNSEKVAALFLEVIQGEGGIHVLDKDYVKEARRLTAEHNVLLIIDEIQTGLARTGKLFGYEHFGVIPDAITLAKGLGGGFPIGAMIVRSDAAQLFDPGRHGSTFGGNHLATRVAYEVIRVIMTRDILVNVDGMSEYAFRRLRALQVDCPWITDVRGIGLHIGFELNQPGQVVVDECRRRGLLVNCTAEKTIRILPPLNIDLETIAKGLDILEGVIRDMPQLLPQK